MSIQEERVRQLIAETESRFREDRGALLQASRDEIGTGILKHRGEITAHRAEIVDQQKRIDDPISRNNNTMGRSGTRSSGTATR